MRVIILLLLVGTLQAQNYHTFNVPVSVGGATNASSLLTLNSTTQGFLIPRMTTAQRDAIPTPAVGLQIYNTETNTINIFNGTWVALSGGGGIGGTIAAGQVAFGSASNTLAGSNNLFWDNANSRLGLNTTTPAGLVEIKNPFNSSRTVFSITADAQNRVTLGDATNTSTGTYLLLNHSVFGSRLVYAGNGITIFGAYTALPSAIFHHQTNNVGIGTGTTIGAKLQVLSGGTANTSLSFLTQNSSATNTFSVGDAGLVTIYKDTESSGTQSSARLMVESGDANTNLVLSPKGTGAFIVGPAPTVAQGTQAVSMYGSATGAGSVAIGAAAGLGTVAATSTYAVAIGGVLGTRAQGSGSVVIGGVSNTASGGYSAIIGGGSNQTIGGQSGVFAGAGYTISAAESVGIGGNEGVGYLRGQVVTSSKQIAHKGDNQTSHIRLLRQITGFSNRTLSLNGVDTTSAFLPVLTPPTGNTSRVWNARLQCVAVTNVQGTGGPAAGSVFSETMDITIKRIGTVTSIVNGTPMHSVSVSDVGMSGADFLVDADDTNESLQVRFQPPTIAAADTQIRAVCTVYLTEIGY